MTIRTLLLYLMGDRQAILTLASDRRVPWIGLLFVLSAGFAREYDRKDLLHEPWHLLVPFVASLVSSLVLFTILYVRVMRRDANRPSFFEAYESFLGLFWMTAPLAWFYAVPYERFLAPPTAEAANLATLGLVAFWRVVLMIRVASVLMGYSTMAAVFLVMVYANVAALLAVHLLPVPIVLVMGGLSHLTETQQVTYAVGSAVARAATWLLPVCLIGATLAMLESEPTWQVRPHAESLPASSARALWLLGVISVVVWMFILPWTQPPLLR